MHAEGEGLVHTSRFFSLLSGMGMARANVGGNESNDALVIQTTCHTHQLVGHNFIEFHRISTCMVHQCYTYLEGQQTGAVTKAFAGPALPTMTGQQAALQGNRA